MKKIIYLIAILFLVFTADFSIAEMYDVPKEVVIDKEHEEIFDNFVLDFINKTFEEEKLFEDGDYIQQKLTGVHLERIDRLGDSIERYTVHFTFYVKRFVKGDALYTEEFLLQQVYFDLINGKVFKYYVLDTIDISNMLLKKEI